MSVPFGRSRRCLPGDAISIISSLKRTRQTFEAITVAGACMPEPVVEPDLAEQSFGRWEGLSWVEMQARDPDAYAAFWENPTRNAPPGGESFAAQMRRAAAAIERLNIEFAGRDIVSVSHGGTIRAAIAHALGLTPEAAMAIVIDNLSLTRLSLVHDRLLSPGRATWLVQAVNVPCRRLSTRSEASLQPPDRVNALTDGKQTRYANILYELNRAI